MPQREEGSAAGRAGALGLCGTEGHAGKQGQSKVHYKVGLKNGVGLMREQQLLGTLSWDGSVAHWQWESDKPYPVCPS